MKKLSFIVMPLMAVSLLASCSKESEGTYKIETQCSYCYFDSIQESYKGGSDVDLILRLYDGEYTLPSNPEVYFNDKLAIKDTDYTYTVNGLTANLKFKIKSNVKIVASVDELSKPLTFTATTDNSSLSLYLVSYGSVSTDLDLEYKVNDGEWKKVEIPKDHSESSIADNLNINDAVQLRGDNEFWSYVDDESLYTVDRLFMFTTGENDRFAVSGNIMSLLDKEKFVDKKDVSRVEFKDIFGINGYLDGYCQITDASKLCLPATNLSVRCYESMFESALIEKAPYLPATTLAEGCYDTMFCNCDNLIIAPKLMATKIAPDAYEGIFLGCSNLTKVEVSFTATSAIDWPSDEYLYPCTQDWLTWVPDKGTFVWPGETDYYALQMAGLLSTRTGGYDEEVNYIPAGWTVVNP